MDTLVVSGAIAGSIYGLVACAIVFIYRASRIVNLAQGDMGMLAAFVFFALSVRGGVPVIVGVVIALAAGGLLGWLVNGVVIRPLGECDQGTGLVVTLALSAIIQLTVLQIWGSSAHFLPPWIAGWDGIDVAGMTLRGPEVLALTVSVVFVLVGSVLYQRTPLGLRLRAVSESRQAAAVLGVHVHRVSSQAWLLGGVMSAGAALLIAPLTRFDPYFMFAVMTSALVAALLAGFTSFAIAMSAAVLIGVLRSVAGFYTALPGFEDVLLLGFAVAVLLVKPPARLRTVT